MSAHVPVAHIAFNPATNSIQCVLLILVVPTTMVGSVQVNVDSPRRVRSLLTFVLKVSSCVFVTKVTFGVTAILDSLHQLKNNCFLSMLLNTLLDREDQWVTPKFCKRSKHLLHTRLYA